MCLTGRSDVEEAYPIARTFYDFEGELGRRLQNEGGTSREVSISS